MLLQFSVKNFLSFKDKQVFTTLANSDKTHAKDNLISFGSKKYSKINVIYGANASGKTNLCKALQFIKWFVINSNNLLENIGTTVLPFAFDERMANTPSSFELLFVKSDIKYAYSFSCTRFEVVEERLDIFEKGQPKLVFNRTNTANFEFNSYEKSLRPIVDKNTKNKLFLCTASNWNFEVTKPVVDFIINDLLIIFDYSTDLPMLIKRLKDANDYDEYKAFCLKLLSIGDFSISDFDVKITEIESIPPELGAFMQAFIAKNDMPVPQTQKLIKTELTTFHTFNNENGESKCPMNLAFESLGTQAMFNFAPVLYDILKNGRVLIVDEIDKSLHPLIVRYIVSLFADSSSNKHGAQLICNTHDTNLLDLDLLRRDEIWFTERDPQTGSTSLYPLTDYSPRKGENIENGYLVGRYGAIPFINKTVKLWE